MPTSGKKRAQLSAPRPSRASVGHPLAFLQGARSEVVSNAMEAFRNRETGVRAVATFVMHLRSSSDLDGRWGYRRGP